MVVSSAVGGRSIKELALESVELIVDFTPPLHMFSENELALDMVFEFSIGLSTSRLVNRSLGKGNVVGRFGAGCSDADAQMEFVTDFPRASTTGVMMGRERYNVA